MNSAAGLRGVTSPQLSRKEVKWDRDVRIRRQQQFMLELLTRKIQTRAQELYEQRGGGEGRALEDWVRAESEILSTSILAPLYRRAHSQHESQTD